MAEDERGSREGRAPGMPGVVGIRSEPHRETRRIGVVSEPAPFRDAPLSRTIR